MRKISYRTVLLSSIGLLFPMIGAWATDCTPVPDCASLGYTKSESDCSGTTSIKCPFDTSKVFCQKQTTTSTYPCSSGNYITVSNPSAFRNDCSTSQFITIVNSSQFICQATHSTPTQLGSGVKYSSSLGNATLGNATTICNSAYSYAKQTLVAGCCDASGKTTALFPSVRALTPTITTYKVGDTYMKDGIAMGTVVQVDSTGQHGTVAISRGKAASSSEATATCNSLSAGGLLWSLAKCEHYCQLLLSGDGFSTDCGYCSCVGTSDFCYHGTKTNLAVACSAPF